MPDENKQKLRLVILTRRFQFDRAISFVFVGLGLILQSPVMIFSGALFFLLTAFDAFLRNRLEKQLADVPTPPSPTEN